MPSIARFLWQQLDQLPRTDLAALHSHDSRPALQESTPRFRRQALICSRRARSRRSTGLRRRTIMRRFATALLLCFTLSSPRSVAQEVEDIGFETGKIGSTPKGWFVPVDGWKAELSEEKAAVGQRAARLFKPGESTARFGNLMHSRPANELGGRHITLSAKVLVVGEGRGQMWLRVDLA